MIQIRPKPFLDVANWILVHCVNTIDPAQLLQPKIPATRAVWPYPEQIQTPVNFAEAAVRAAKNGQAKRLFPKPATYTLQGATAFYAPKHVAALCRCTKLIAAPFADSMEVAAENAVEGKLRSSDREGDPIARCSKVVGFTDQRCSWRRDKSAVGMLTLTKTRRGHWRLFIKMKENPRLEIQAS